MSGWVSLDGFRPPTIFAGLIGDKGFPHSHRLQAMKVRREGGTLGGRADEMVSDDGESQDEPM